MFTIEWPSHGNGKNRRIPQKTLKHGNEIKTAYFETKKKTVRIKGTLSKT